MKWLYICYDADLNAHQIIASSKLQARRQLLMQGKYAVKVKTQTYIGITHFKQSELLIITKQLATLLKVGLPIVESLALLAKEHRQPEWQYLLTQIKQQIMKGDLLSKALTHYPNVFIHSTVK